jgi:hypothetical protein
MTTMSKLVIAYLVIGGVVSTGFAAVQWMGWEPGTAEREVIPPSARESPGGYRSYSFWHTGFHGGK